mgnify:CR=1 FL=1
MLPLFSVNAFALDLKYAHEYEDLSNEHTDKIQLSHTFDNGIGDCYYLLEKFLTTFFS